MIIAIDGPAGAGKSTAREGAARLGLLTSTPARCIVPSRLLRSKSISTATQESEKIIALAAELPLHFEENGMQEFSSARAM